MDARQEIYDNMVEIAACKFSDQQKDYILEAMQRYADSFPIVQWFSPSEKLPELDENVLIACVDGSVTWGMRAERIVNEKQNGIYRPTGKRQIEWGQEENGFEYWHEIDDVVLWAYFPKSPI
jgi:hypothetical protein